MTRRTSWFRSVSIEHAIDWIVDHEIDTSRLDAFYNNDGCGRPAYDPKACRTNIVFMALCGDVHPDHATIARFVTAHAAALPQVFRDVLLIAAQGDLIAAELFALDGRKISSNAAKEHSGSHAELRKKVGKLDTVWLQ